MIYRWIDKNVELDKLGQAIEKFFKDKGMKARIERKSQKEILVHVIVQAQKKRKIVTAKISGKPEDFLVEFPLESYRLKIFSNILLTLGGGIFVLKEIENKEILGKLEDEFWAQLKKIIESGI